ncbi:hypothetical protein C1X72_02020 [Pseudomonas sp. FW306-2-2C-D06B]|uniref:hypothetical protein n=1 Tax=unclassified Pseudomonas TaxID=196821 RepID=UPI000C88CA4F|nr:MULTISPECIES: hypothetical protein [unclassified Pseudomonas]PMY82845.1 hypothetical protein C1X72_02020 [Pseudomonas sp. FW306-2-2C-D06B]
MHSRREYLKPLVLVVFSYTSALPPAVAGEPLAVESTAAPPLATETTKPESVPLMASKDLPHGHSPEPGLTPASQTVVYVISALEEVTSPAIKEDKGAVESWVKILEALAKLLASIAWPAAAVIMVGFFRKELASLMARIRSFKAGSAEAEFSEDVNQTAAERLDTSDQRAPEVEIAVVRDAALDPRGTILNAWLKIEHAASRLYQLHFPSEPNRITRFVGPSQMNDLVKAGLISKDTFMFYRRLQHMRNQATHELDFSPSLDSVVLYVQLAHELHATIESAIQKFNDNTQNGAEV